eukprot:scaffold155087_cov34-Prasinocladus_malaysianus.AAC.1
MLVAAVCRLPSAELFIDIRAHVTIDSVVPYANKHAHHHKTIQIVTHILTNRDSKATKVARSVVLDPCATGNSMGS